MTLVSHVRFQSAVVFNLYQIRWNKMQIIIGNNDEGFGSELLCPNCCSSYLHHYKVDVFERTQDAKVGIHCTVSGEITIIDRLLEGNPSPRRNGLNIFLWCEKCAVKSVFSVSQHKGHTIIDLKCIN
ncbi:hypothetical protein Ppro_1897 [Pelobacter propionicus DSM 2379]|uniref:Uncharacterized protein n=1 Tax=Pelobacter propionicus (strain DSM 2379 / NBRC 103807 / OttBd1) TaxID=338966 RepID=A1AQ87_PELPD|nr:hypothetical protein Ppro_1897 [Pelobacter propionicus DSM 2379]